MIKVLEAGFLTTVQDSGRFGFAEFGVPVSGAMDLYSFELCNRILNNSITDATIEITLGRCKLQFLVNTEICISGADFSPMLNGNSISLNTKIPIISNDVLSFGKVNYGVRCYVAVKGGILSKKVLNSRSFYENITEKAKIEKGDVLQILEIKTIVKPSNTSVKINYNHFNNKTLACYKGPEFELLSKEIQHELFSKDFTISSSNNRMGYKLKEALTKIKKSEILTSGVLPGTVQLTPSGILIILMRDCQVTGGYPRVLQLTDASINCLSQKYTNQIINFSLLSLLS